MKMVRYSWKQTVRYANTTRPLYGGELLEEQIERRIADALIKSGVMERGLAQRVVVKTVRKPKCYFSSGRGSRSLRDYCEIGGTFEAYDNYFAGGKHIKIGNGKYLIETEVVPQTGVDAQAKEVELEVHFDLPEGKKLKRASMKAGKTLVYWED
jgi:hypothetical protein